jgi:hypothetical protein
MGILIEGRLPVRPLENRKPFLARPVVCPTPILALLIELYRRAIAKPVTGFD